MEWDEYIKTLNPTKVVLTEEPVVTLPLDEMTPEAEEELSNGVGDEQ